ncbi:MAG: hypothetical protein O3A51_14170 [Verrucomicrobia bacterium]|nr:hypothetical protein [Verrucomicrobiota bacterium]
MALPSPEKLERAGEVLMIVGGLAFVLGGPFATIAIPGLLGISLFVAGWAMGRGDNAVEWSATTGRCREVPVPVL